MSWTLSFNAELLTYFCRKLDSRPSITHSTVPFFFFFFAGSITWAIGKCYVHIHIGLLAPNQWKGWNSTALVNKTWLRGKGQELLVFVSSWIWSQSCKELLYIEDCSGDYWMFTLFRSILKLHRFLVLNLFAQTYSSIPPPSIWMPQPSGLPQPHWKIFMHTRAGTQIPSLLNTNVIMLSAFYTHIALGIKISTIFLFSLLFSGLFMKKSLPALYPLKAVSYRHFGLSKGATKF